MTPRPIVIDTGPGPGPGQDDALAILPALASPSMKVLSVP